MNATDPWAVELLNISKNVWWVLWSYPTKSSAEAELNRWGGRVGGRPLRVGER